MPIAADECWAMDFVHDNLADGRTIRILTISNSNYGKFLDFASN